VAVGDDLAALPLTAGATDWFVRNGSTSVTGAQNFVRERGRLIHVVSHAYFEVMAVPVSSVLRFGDGWYGAESVGLIAWRWMGSHSETLLPGMQGTAKLRLAFDIPTELIRRHPTVEIRLNDQIVDRILCTTASVSKNWVVRSRAGAPNRLEISIDRVLNPAKEHISGDSRDLGLKLTDYGWEVSQSAIRPESSPRLNQ